MSVHQRLLQLAAVESRRKQDHRTFCLGAIGIRSDGTIVRAWNGNPREPEPRHHAEYRLSRKLTRDSIVYVARTLADGTWANARPCADCMARLKNVKVSRVYYTIRDISDCLGEGPEYGVVDL